MKINHFDTNRFSFCVILCNNIGIDHELLSYIHSTTYKITSDDIFNSSFEYIYKQFIKNIIKPTITTHRIYYNTIPKIYCNFPNETVNNILSNDYIDDQQLSVILPITSMYDTNTFWTDDENPQPCNIDYGEFMLLDQKHKSFSYPVNKTNNTSVYISFNVSFNKNSRKDLSII